MPSFTEIVTQVPELKTIAVMAALVPVADQLIMRLIGEEPALQPEQGWVNYLLGREQQQQQQQAAK